MNETSAKSEYKHLSEGREPYLKRGRMCAKVTVPSLLPDKDTSDTTDFDTPYQSIGSTGVRTISSKLLLALYPSNIPCFKYQLDDYTVDKIAQGQGTRGSIEKALDARARAVKVEMENSKFRPVVFEAARQMVVTGNYLLYIPPDPKKDPRGFRLTNYVCQRDPSGTVLKIIIKESIAFSGLPKETQEVIRLKSDSSQEIKPTDTFDLFTYVWKTEMGLFKEFQEVEGERIDGSEGSYRPEYLPYVPLRFTSLDNEDYGRSLIDEFLGDLLTLEGLSQAILEGAAISSRVLWQVSPNSSADVDDYSEAENGGYVEGEEGDVVPLVVNKQGDLSVASNLANEITQRLSVAFMMHRSVQRDAERVTAEEIRTLSQELDDTFGGVYSLQSVEFQLPAVRLYEKRMERAKRVPPLPKEVDVKPVIVTGIEALGRQRDLQDLDQMIASVAEFVPKEQISQVINLSEYFKRRAAASGIDTDGLIMDQQEQQQGMNQEKMMEMLKQALPQLISQGGGMMREQQKQQQQQ